MADQRARLRPIDVEQVIADYQAGATLAAITRQHSISATRLYAILDDHNIARRRSTTLLTPPDVEQRIVDDYRAGQRIEDIAVRHGVSTSTVSNIARRSRVELRAPQLQRSELIDLAARRLLGEPISDDTKLYDALRRIGLRSLRPGLASLDDLAPELRRDVAVEIARRLRERYGDEHGYRPGPRTMYPQLYERSWMLARQHLPAKAVAAEVGCSTTAVYWARKVLDLLPLRQTDQRPELDDDEWLQQQVDSGGSAATIAAALGAPEFHVVTAMARLARRRNIPTRRAGKPKPVHRELSDVDWLTANADRGAGPIAAELGCASNTVRYAFRRHGIELATRQPGAVGDQTVRSMLAEGLTQSEIARRLGVTPQAISFRVRRLRSQGLID